jgi:PAS domain S-box-containing protein
VDPADDPTVADRTPPEQRLRSSEERFRKVYDNAPTGIAITDWSGRFEQCNPAYSALVGYSEDELRDRSFAELVHPEDRAANLAEVRRLQSGEVPYVEIENRYLRSDGEPVWVHKFISVLRDGGQEPRLLALVSDVTERRRLDDLLRGSEERFRSMFEHAAVGVAHVDLDGCLVQVNAAFSAIVGRPRSELEGLSFQDITHPDDLQEDLGYVTALVEGSIDSYSMRKRYVRGDGSTVWVNLTGSVVRGADGRPDHFVAVIEDITEDLARETAERRARARAELSSEVMARLEGAATASEQARGLVAVLVPRFADYATVEAPDEDDPVLAAAHRDPELNEVLWELRRSHRVGRDEPNSVARAAHGEVQLITDVTPDVLGRYDLDDDARRLLERLSPRSHMSVPLDLGGGRSGALMVGRTGEDAAGFDREDLDFLRGLAQRAGTFLVRAYLREQEHRISLRLQQALLPDELAATAAVQVAGRYYAATEMLEVGGDGYDSIALPDSRILVVVGDVVGHGLEAAAVMGRLRSGLAALAARDPEPGRLLVELDRFARARRGADLATVACAVIDPDSGRTVHASAGHPPMLVVPRDGEAYWLDGGRSAPLCTFELDERPQAVARLEPGSVLVLYSDGLVERRREPLHVGLDRLRGSALRHRAEPVGTLGDLLIDDLTAGVETEDDVVVLCVRFDPGCSFSRTLVADPSQLAVLRGEIRGWVLRSGLTDADARDLLLAVGEACANAVEHAYLDRTDGTFDVDLELSDDGIRARVRDRGTWRPPGHAEGRGRGTGIIEAVSRDVRRETGPDGTVVSFVVPIASDRS